MTEMAEPRHLPLQAMSRRRRTLSMRAAFIVWTLGSSALWLALIFVVRGF
jgi:hypothetical protein